jgi:hypothetical protein
MSALTEPGERELRRKFRVYDQDDSGSISMDELSSLISDLGHELSEDEIKLSFQQYDADSSGRIDFEEFTRWWNDGGGLARRGGGGDEGGEDTAMKTITSSKLTMLGPSTFLYMNHTHNCIPPYPSPPYNVFSFSVEVMDWKSVEVRLSFGDSKNLKVLRLHPSATFFSSGASSVVELPSIPPFTRVELLALTLEDSLSEVRLRLTSEASRRNGCSVANTTHPPLDLILPTHMLAHRSGTWPIRPRTAPLCCLP